MKPQNGSSSACDLSQRRWQIVRRGRWRSVRDDAWTEFKSHPEVFVSKTGANSRSWDDCGRKTCLPESHRLKAVYINITYDRHFAKYHCLQVALQLSKINHYLRQGGVMFYPAFVSMNVCLLVTLRESYWSDLYENFIRCVRLGLSVDEEELIKLI